MQLLVELPVFVLTNSIYIMKTTLLFLLTVGSLSAVHAQNWKEDRPVSNLSGVQVSTGINLVITQGGSEKLTLEATGFEKNEVKSTIKNGVLQLSIDRRNQGMSGYGRNRNVNAYLTFRQLKSIEASSGSNIKAPGKLNFSDLSLSSSSGADIELDLKADDLSLDVSSGADATLRGAVKTLSARVSGGAELDAGKLTAEICNAQASGGADATVYATRELRLQASGGADLSYDGPASVVSKQKSGGADISKR